MKAALTRFAERPILYRSLLFALFSVYLYFPLFLHLGGLPVNMWDESLFALRALYFLQEGSYMADFNLFDGTPDHMNTKLPFTTFFQVLGLKLFGVNELGLRIPIAIIFLSTVFYSCYFALKEWGTVAIGTLLGIILVSNTAFVDTHMLRTGDQDAPFACYLFLAVLFFYRFLERFRSSSLIAFSVCMIAAFLTKNLLAGIIFPGLIAYALYRHSFLRLLRDHRTYIALFAILGTYAGTILYYEMQIPGFFERMWNYELMGRYQKEIEGHSGGFFYYFHPFLQGGFRPFGHFLIIAFLLPLDRRMDDRYRRGVVLATFVFFSYLLIISFSETKTSWYDAPLYPLAALIIALGVQHLYSSYLSGFKLPVRLAFIGLGAAVIATPYSQTLAHVYKPEPKTKDQEYDPYIERLRKEKPSIKEFTIVDKGFGTAPAFIRAKYEAMDESYSIGQQRGVKDLSKGDRVMTCYNRVHEDLGTHYEIELIHRSDNCRLIKVLEKKKISGSR